METISFSFSLRGTPMGGPTPIVPSVSEGMITEVGDNFIISESGDQLIVE